MIRLFPVSHRIRAPICFIASSRSSISRKLTRIVVPPPNATESDEDNAADNAASHSVQGKTATTWKSLLISTYTTVLHIFWPLILIHAVADAFLFCLHRLSHRATNEVALAVLRLPQDSFSDPFSLWWLSSDPLVASWETGYQLVSALFFVFVFPLHTALKSWATAATIILCTSSHDVQPYSLYKTPWWRPFKALKMSLSFVWKTLASSVNSAWKRVFAVELLVAAIVLPLQVASLAVITLPFTLPIIVELQSSSVVAVMEAKEGKQALSRSRQLLKPLKWTYAVPFVGLIVLQKVLDAVKGALLTGMPTRFYRELVEIPLALMIGSAVAGVVLGRMQDVLPTVIYRDAVKIASNK